MCSHSSSSDDDEFPCYLQNYSLKRSSAQSSPSSSSVSLDTDREAVDNCPVDENDELRLSSCTSNTLTSSMLLHSMRHKLFDERHCYVMDAKLQGNIGRFLNVCDVLYSTK